MKGVCVLFSQTDVVSNACEVLEYLDENFENGMRIMAGRFYLDPNRKFWGGMLQGVSRFTWEGFQNWVGYNAGHSLNFLGQVDRVDYFGGATFLTNENDSRRNPEGDGNGIALGSFININIPGEIPTNISFHDFVLSTPLYMHEYGHVLQSERTGIAFAVNYGIPSIFSAIKDRNNPDHDHESYRTETSANRWAQKYFGDRYNVDWSRFSIDYPLR